MKLIPIGQIREVMKADVPSSLALHRVITSSGHPACGQPTDDWNGQKMSFVFLGLGTPTCGRPGCK